MFIKNTALAFFLTCFFIAPSQASIKHVQNKEPRGPFQARNQNPLFLTMINQPLDRVTSLEKGKYQFSVDTTFSNLFERNLVTSGVGIDLDMELVRSALQFSYGINNHLEAGIEIPFLNFSGGFLDAFVGGYHDALGLPDGGRSTVDNGRYSYRVTRNGATIYQVNSLGLGLSDFILWDKFKIFDETKVRPAIGVKTSLKLPTGQAEKGTGNNKVDVAFSILAEKSLSRWHFYTQLGVAAFGTPPDLQDVTRHGAMLYGQAVEFNFSNRISLIAQINGQTSPFRDTSVPELTKTALDLNIGIKGDVPLKKGFHSFFYEVTFSEDPISNGPSVDFSTYVRMGFTK
ncbi:MAG: hypothetical protein A3G32_09795 [Deltaproteobacteria bacterium RIFCSPLOWO2_12_FULL_40_28]|nr:MAG: hypothetical protein A3C45_04230 [Deltaproteobacteria bacterium RIFCSPHIGHO2_02_FULL_40_28]OGQ21079.1 MAG: hypothetical protein A3E27_00135 [Deltaproteobacteria bacterium RIFCSPHIGHO2_12_FULL_40_32]OGQ38991.1 MAG: hypothetical protein A3I69_07665 [Deltaproteobacteria bacterium RIFCSPLOWO2_02_FULL_40_36]OGQ53045.1 MAG: hypothetical protein A3G32_09795 [Deltaproteobacteria bacterium RIFCSPLOWO2_12_FULL_40_28]